MVRWDCGFTYESFLLFSQYAALSVVFSVYLYRLWFIPKRHAQKSFLTLGLLESLLRGVYFILWPILYQNSASSRCSPMTSGDNDNDSLFMTILGTWTPCLFLTAFAVNVYTTARIYHTRLHKGNMRLFRWVTGIISFAIISAHILVILNMLPIKDKDLLRRIDFASAMCIIATTFIVAVGFLVYSFLLHRDFRRKQIESFYATHAPTSSRTISDAQHARRHRGSDEVLRARGGLTNVDAVQLPANPMKKLLWTSALCMVCFTFRVVILPVIVLAFDGNYPSPWVFFYLFFSEILPASLMLYIFESRPAHQEAPAQLEETLTSSGATDPLLAAPYRSPAPVRSPSLTYDRSTEGQPGSYGAAGSRTGSYTPAGQIMNPSSPTAALTVGPRLSSNFAASMTPGADRVKDMFDPILPRDGSMD